MTAGSLPNPVVMVIVLGALTLAPFVLIMLTSFVKISVVLSILRNAIGTQSVPPSQVITGLAFVLSFFIMSPVAEQMYHDAGYVPDTRDMFSEASVKTVFDAISRGREPLRHFLERHAHNEDRRLFVGLAQRLEESSKADRNNKTRSETTPAPVVASDAHKEEEGHMQPQSQAANPVVAPGPAPTSSAASTTAPSLSQKDFQVLVPAFVTSQLKEAFEVGFLIFIPFVVIDMVIANILLAMGMSMLSPSVISLPFKLLLFVLVDGWFLIIRGLVLSYA